LLLVSPAVWGAAVLIDVRADMVSLGIGSVNAVGDGKADDSACIQAAIDYAAKNGGGRVVLPPGVYRVKDIKLPAGVCLVGAGPQKTIFRAADTCKVMIQVGGGELLDFAIYGTPSEDDSGENWKVGTKGLGEGSSAVALHIISVRGATRGAVISNVHVREAQNDCLYVRGSKGLRVLNCEFDRAGRNVVSMVGDDEDFVFSNCRIGSLWGLYHFDIEPSDGRYVRDGLFVNCIFDGAKAGSMGTDTWGSFMCFSGHGELKSRNITVTGCTFENVYVRVRGIFPQVSFLHNTINRRPAFIRIDSNNVGELRDVVMRGNRFKEDAKAVKDIVYGVSFTGKCVFADNVPAVANELRTVEAK
jgi:polygalacturonase